MAIKLEGSAATCTVTFCLPLGIFGIQSCFIAYLCEEERKDLHSYTHINPHTETYN